MAAPITDFAGLKISRLICGSNPFLGYSYRSSGHNAWQKRHFMPECPFRTGVTPGPSWFGDGNQ
jgi:hypothetical protein